MESGEGGGGPSPSTKRACPAPSHPTTPLPSLRLAHRARRAHARQAAVRGGAGAGLRPRRPHHRGDVVPPRAAGESVCHAEPSLRALIHPRTRNPPPPPPNACRARSQGRRASRPTSSRCWTASARPTTCRPGALPPITSASCASGGWRVSARHAAGWAGRSWLGTPCNLLSSSPPPDIRVADWSEEVAPFWGAVIRSALTAEGVAGLLKAGWATIKVQRWWRGVRGRAGTAACNRRGHQPSPAVV